MVLKNQYLQKNNKRVKKKIGAEPYGGISSSKIALNVPYLDLNNMQKVLHSDSKLGVHRRHEKKLNISLFLPTQYTIQIKDQSMALFCPLCALFLSFALMWSQSIHPNVKNQLHGSPS